MINNEQLSAYLDGELEQVEKERVCEAIARDELLAARLNRFRDMDQLLRACAGRIDAQPLPLALRLKLGLREADTGTQAPATLATTVRPARGMRRLSGGLSLAAGVLVAILVGLSLYPHEDAAVRTAAVAPGPVAAGTALADALEHLPSQASDAGQGIELLLSFVSAQEGACREFRVVSDRAALRGLACRRHAGWETLQVAPERVAAGDGDFETASADTPQDYDAFVDRLIETGPLDAEREAALIRGGWRLD